MKKTWIVLVMLTISLLVVVPVFAQDASKLPSIAETVVAATQDDPAEFTTLLAAVQAADPAVLEKLSDPEANLLVFAPTDAAFAALKETIGEEAFNAVLADQEQLTNILLYHVVEAPADSGAVGTMEDMSAGLQLFGGSLALTTLSGQSVDLTVNEDEETLVDGANIVTADIKASNGSIEAIDAVLMPETRTIAEMAAEMAADTEAPQFVTLMAAVAAADSSVAATLSDPDVNLTVFAPTDQAFAAVGAETLSAVLADQKMLTDILLYHVLPQNVHAFDLLINSDTTASLMSEEGLSVDTALENQQVVIKAGGDDKGFSLTINSANVIIRDVDTVNGVIHVIDAVLLPSE